MIGQFDGDYRFNAIYRSQWKSVTKPYSTIGISADSKGIGLQPLGLGVHFFHDQTGDGRFQTIDFIVGGSYELNLDFKKDNEKLAQHSIIPGVQIGLNHRQIDLSKLSFDNQYNGWYYDPNLPSGEAFQTHKKTNFSLNLGLGYKWKKDKRTQVLFTYTLANATRPNQTFFGNKEVRRDTRSTFYVSAQFKVAKKWDVLPKVYLSQQGKYNEFIFGADGKYIFSDERGLYMAIYGGVYYRNKDAMYLTLMFDYNNWRAGVSYDLNFSQLVPASRVRGGFEISLQYILKTFKPKKIQHRVCPDYI